MFWEDVYRMVKVASNYTADEENTQLKFRFFLQASEKAAKAWEDTPLPYPGYSPFSNIKKKKDITGISQLPKHMREHVWRTSAT